MLYSLFAFFHPIGSIYSDIRRNFIYYPKRALSYKGIAFLLVAWGVGKALNYSKAYVHGLEVGTVIA